MTNLYYCELCLEEEKRKQSRDPFHFRDPYAKPKVFKGFGVRSHLHFKHGEEVSERTVKTVPRVGLIRISDGKILASWVGEEG